MVTRFLETLNGSEGGELDSWVASKFPTLPLSGNWNEGQETSAPKSGKEPQDEVLLLRLANGDQEALGLLFQRYARVVHGIAARILRDASEADDLVQDLFLFIQRKCAIFDSSKSSAGSWIVQMTYQRAIERRRYLVTRHFYRHEDVQSGASHVVGNATVENDYSAEAVFGRNGLEKVLGSLSEDQRETLRLHFFEGYTLAEIGAKLGQPLGNVRHHYYRGLGSLRKQMFGRKVRGS
jgi:RNA polymerase sigma-70 factor (ECF subfamily)